MEQQELFEIASPCIQVCELDKQGYCKGCLRNRTERDLWLMMNDSQKRQVTGYERALTFSTGYMANVGVIQALCGKDSEIFSDKLNHASIVAQFQRIFGVFYRL